MAEERRRRKTWIALLLLLLLLALLFARCRCAEPESVAPVQPAGGTTTPPAQAVQAPPRAEGTAEVLGAATVAAPAEVRAGAKFTVKWTGPDNADDYVTIVAAGTVDADYGSFRETKEGAKLELVAPVTPGACEVRYVTGRSRTVLARAPLAVTAAAATLTAPDEIVLGKPVTIAWTGPNDPGDYVTIVMQGTVDADYGDYDETARGSPLTVTAPTTPGAAEVRYVTGQGRKVLARRPLRILEADVSLSAQEEALAGSTISVAWTGPDNAGDYVTIVAPGTSDADYGNYRETHEGSPFPLLMPVAEGEHELRYVTGQGHHVLARRTIRLVAAKLTLAAPDQVAAGASFDVEWTGPAHSGDYITIVAAGAEDAQYGSYSDVSAGSPAKLNAPKEPVEAEIRYVASQGRKVLARRPIRVTP